MMLDIKKFIKTGLLTAMSAAIVLFGCGSGEDDEGDVDGSGNDQPPVTTFTLTTNPSPIDGGTVSPSGTTNHSAGTDVDIIAYPANGYVFTGWTGQGVANRNNARTTVSMTENRSVLANFAPREPENPTVTFYCPMDCEAEQGANRPTGCFETLDECMAFDPDDSDNPLITYYCPMDCDKEEGTSRPSDCFPTQELCMADATDDDDPTDPPCTAGVDCDEDAGYCDNGCSLTTRAACVFGTFSTTRPVSCDVQTGDTFTDSRDGQVYRIVEIGDQVWMADNLNYRTPNGSWCYDDDPLNCAIYGRLYDWSAAMNIDEVYNSAIWGGSDVKHRGVCPNGWHLPSRDDWQTLVDYAGGWEMAGIILRSVEGWDSTGVWGDYIEGVDDLGFSALPGGGRWADFSFDNIGYYGYWWITTETDATGVRARSMHYNDEVVSAVWYDKTSALSVRCLRD